MNQLRVVEHASISQRFVWKTAEASSSCPRSSFNLKRFVWKAAAEDARVVELGASTLQKFVWKSRPALPRRIIAALQSYKGSSGRERSRRRPEQSTSFNPTKVRLEARPSPQDPGPSRFNPTKVRLEVDARVAASDRDAGASTAQKFVWKLANGSHNTLRACFDPTKVRLKARRVVGASCRPSGFNPTKVRLKVLRRVGRVDRHVTSTSQRFV